MVFNDIFNNNCAIYRGSQFYWWRKSEYPEKTLSQVSDKLYHNVVSRFELTKSVVVDTDCTDSCKSNYHTMTTTMYPLSIDIQ